MITPQNVEAEKAVLGALLVDKDCFHDISMILIPEDFYNQTNAEIYKSIIELRGQDNPVDIITVHTLLEKKNIDVSLDHLVSMADISTSTNASYHASLVLEAAKRRKLMKVARKLYEDSAVEDIERTVQEAEKAIMSINREVNRGIYKIGDVIEKTLLDIEERSKAKSNICGIPTGFTDIDYKLGGLQRSDLIIIAGRPSMGKTSLAENITTYVSCDKQLPAAFFSLEMNRDSIGSRTVSSYCLVDNHKIRLGKLEDNDWDKIGKYSTSLINGMMYIDDTPHQKASEIASKCRRLKAKHGDLALVVVDHLTEMWRPMKGDDRAEHEENVRSLKRLAKELECPVVLMQQLNRQCEQRADKRPMLSDLKETGASEEVADVVMFVYRDDYYNPDTEKKNIAEIIIAKGRNYGTGTVELAWLGQYTKFANLERWNSNEQGNGNHQQGKAKPRAR